MLYLDYIMPSFQVLLELFQELCMRPQEKLSKFAKKYIQTTFSSHKTVKLEITVIKIVKQNFNNLEI